MAKQTEFREGPEAAENFEEAMQILLCYPRETRGQETWGQTGRFLAKVTEKVPSAPAHHDRMYLPPICLLRPPSLK